MNKRKILFRGKHIDNGEWVEGYYFRQYGSDEIVTADEQYHIIPETRSEYTGLTDKKNGTKIFEGDIVKVLLSGNPQPIGVVKYGVTGICGFCVITERGYSNYVLDKSEYFEVIGNVYDNPELLKCDNRK